ncbi:transporter, major intrinsic protein (MIP) domain protein [Leptospira interrogans serovar Grippotyphosa str. LT2186]|uniref:Transporter, major intrinsic protein (MIP) domain protein n=1 Tax=Leptospira interrogans serovar Grippotyphosa str. LT2186 TaxID=1001599 RepID=M3I698_LEPIR|nr:transporter, major intrinsic protein (MIP) domain protein [Leptospira interrogans serovar Grippotyphosa str. LT2186]
MGSPILGEFLGTFVLILLGNGVVAGVLLEKSKSKDGGWIVITAGWAFAVMIGVFVSNAFGSLDAHLNPAVTLAFAIQSGDYTKLIFLYSRTNCRSVFRSRFQLPALSTTLERNQRSGKNSSRVLHRTSNFA